MNDDVTRATIDSLERRAQALIEMRAQATKPGHQVKFSWTADLELNAFASIEGGDNIGVSIGTLYALWNYFDAAVCAHSRIIDGKNDDVSNDSYFRLDDSKDIQGQLIQSGNLLSPPLNPARIAISVIMLRTAFDFVIQHEIGHLWNGHVDLVNNVLGLQRLEELRFDTSGALGNRDYQTLEMDADGYALPNALMWSYRNKVTPEFPQGYKFEQIDQKHGDGASRVMLGMAGIHSLFKLLNNNAFSIANLDQDAHPPAVVRAGYTMGVAAQNLTEATTFSEPVDLILSGCAYAEMLFELSCGRELRSEYDFREATEWDYTRELLINWKTLRPELDKLKRGGNLPPIQEDL